MVMSDLHLEIDKRVLPEFPALAPNLILAGDIGRPDIASLQEFLLAQCERFEHIFYVAGNHCFYQGIYEERLEQLQQLDNLHPHIHFLHNKSYLLPNKVRILGTTLWSHVPPEKVDEIHWRLNDYHYISTVVDNQTPRLITVEDTNKWHDQQHAWLLEEIQKARENGEHVVVITHHAPSRHDTCSKEDEERGLMDAFVNDHDADCVDPVRLWFYGHTHRSTDLKINSTRVISNQLGCPQKNCGFRPNMKVNLHEDGTVTVTD
jgi:predicted phosphodiesterase